MYQVNILNSNYYPIRQVMVTSNELSAKTRRNELLAKGILAGIMYYD